MQAIRAVLPVGIVRGLAKQYLFNSTLDVFREALAADNINEAATILIASASRDNEGFWLDIMIMVAGLVIVAVLGSCVLRLGWWLCVTFPLQNLELHKMSQGKLDYQIEAQEEREARRKRIAAGLEEERQSLGSDLSGLMSSMAEVRGRLEKKGVFVEETVVPPQHVTTPEEVATAASDSFKATNIRKGIPTTITSTLRGFPNVDFLVASPSQKFVLVGCRSKRKTVVLPQGNDAAYASQGKELSAAVQSGSLPCVETALSATLNSDRPPEVYSGAFTSDDTRLVVGERDSDTIFSFAVAAGTGQLTLVWSFKMPDRRLVSSLPRWAMLGPESLVTFTNKDCAVEVIRYVAGGAAQCASDRFKVGTATAWAHVADRVAIAGSFLREPRLAKMVTRPNGAVTSDTICVFPNRLKVRVSALALVLKGIPEFNTRSYFIVFLESGECTIYDVLSLEQSNTPAVCATFTDTDFAELDADEPLGLVACVAGKAYHERLMLALFRGSWKVSVYAQSAGHSGGAWTMELLTDIFCPQDNSPVKDVVFLQSGKAIATCGKADNRHVRLFALPPLKTE